MIKSLDEQAEKYAQAYGGEINNFRENKLDDLYSRMGNHILKEMKNYDKTIKRKPSSSRKIEPPVADKINKNVPISDNKENNLVGEIGKEIAFTLEKSMHQLINSMKEEYEYDRMLDKESEKEYER